MYIQPFTARLKSCPDTKPKNNSLTSLWDSTLVADVGHDGGYCGFLFGGEGQERDARIAAVVSVEVAGVFEAGDAVVGSHQARGLDHAALFLLRDAGIVFFPRGVDLLAGLGRGGGEGEDGSGDFGFEGGQEILRG